MEAKANRGLQSPRFLHCSIPSDAVAARMARPSYVPPQLLRAQYAAVHKDRQMCQCREKHIECSKSTHSYRRESTPARDACTPDTRYRP